MMWEYTQADRALRGNDRFRLRLRKPLNKDRQIYGCGIGFGGEESRVGTGQPSDRDFYDIEFQFPPKVLTDGRKATWKESERRGEEPVANFMTSGPREISISWIYVVDSHDTNSDSWTIDRITRNIRTLRGYFANFRERTAKRDALVIRFHMWCIGGDKPISARIRTVDVRYGDTLVFPPGRRAYNIQTGEEESQGRSDRAFPLRTDITLDLRVWTQGKSWREGEGPGIQQLPSLEKREPASWY